MPQTRAQIEFWPRVMASHKSVHAMTRHFLAGGSVKEASFAANGPGKSAKSSWSADAAAAAHGAIFGCRPTTPMHWKTHGMLLPEGIAIDSSHGYRVEIYGVRAPWSKWSKDRAGAIATICERYGPEACQAPDKVREWLAARAEARRPALLALIDDAVKSIPKPPQGVHWKLDPSVSARIVKMTGGPETIRDVLRAEHGFGRAIVKPRAVRAEEISNQDFEWMLAQCG